MKNQPLDKDQKKEAMKQLRNQRKQHIEAVSAIMKTQKKEMKTIREYMQQGDATVPAIAAATEIPVNLTLWYVMAMKKYGEVVEVQKEGGYFKYSLTPQAGAKTENRAGV